MRQKFYLLFVCLSCSSEPAQSTILSPTSASAPSSAGAAIQAPPQIDSLDLRGEFEIVMHDKEVLRDPFDLTIIVRSDGTVESRDKIERKKNNVFRELPGDGKVLKGNLSPADLDSIRTTFESPSFYALKSSYRGDHYDIPSYTLSVKTPTQKKSISTSGMLRSELPPELRQALSRIQSLAPKEK
jgi:hypothetical protein